jgi:hypothetical protein
MTQLKLKAALAVVIAVLAAPAYAAQSVSIENTPLPTNVTNPTTNPVQTRDVDNPARQPFVFYDSDFRVPAGKLYVIEQYSLRCSVDAIGALTDVVLKVDLDSLIQEDHTAPHFTHANGGGPNGPANEWAGTGHTRLYAKAGSLITLDGDSNFNGTGARRACAGNVSGYAVNVP